MKIEEFDERIENEDVFDILDNPTIVSIEKFKKSIGKGKEINVKLSKELFDKLSKKAETLDVRMEDLIKMILAEKVGVL